MTLGDGWDLVLDAGSLTPAESAARILKALDVGAK